MASTWVHLEDCKVKRKTDKAILVEHASGQHWLPLSQVADEAENLNAGDGPVTVSITEWIAEQKEIEV